MENPWQRCDELGPERVVLLHDAAAGLKAAVVVDNTACGPAVGGTRMAVDVSVEECARLARAMTSKNAAAGLPHGGAKSVIYADPAMPRADKERLMRAFARAIADLVDYVPGPDMGTDERCMAWVRDETGRSVGLPVELGGIPLDDIGATGFGLAASADVARRFCDLELDGARLAVQGFGAVGRHAARFLAERGVRLVAACDSTATVLDADGLDIERLAAHKAAGGTFADYEAAARQPRDAVIDADCEIWIPAARPDVLDETSQTRLRARLVLCGANIPATPAAERELAARGVLMVPDFIANAGGVICASVEYRGGTRGDALAAIEEKIRANTEEVLSAARDGGVLPRTAAEAMARVRVERAMSLRRFHR